MSHLMTKTNKMIYAPSEDSDQPRHLPSLTRVFAVRSMGSWGPTDRAQSDLSLRWAQSSCCFGFVMRRLILFWLFKLGFGHVTLTKTFWANLVFSIWWAVSEAGWLDAMIYLWYLATIASEVHMPYRVKRESLLLADSQVFPEIFHICLPSWLAKFEMSEIILKDHKTSLQNKTKSQYRNDPKFLDRYAWANSADPDQTAK